VLLTTLLIAFLKRKETPAVGRDDGNALYGLNTTQGL